MIEWYFYAIVAISFLRKFEVFYSMNIGSVEEFLLVLLIPSFLSGYRMLSRKKRFSQLISTLVFIYISFGLFGWLKYEPVEFDGFISQSILDFKMVYLFFAFVGGRSQINTKRFLFCINSIIIASAMLAAWQLFGLSGYSEVFASGNNNAYFHYKGMSFNRVNGVFWGSTELVTVSTFAIAYYYYLYKSSLRRNILLLMAIVLFVLTYSRQEIFSIAISLMIMAYLLAKSKRIITGYIRTVFVVVPIMVMTILTTRDYWSAFAEKYDILHFESTSEVRIALAYNSVQIAKDRFPFGTGIGGYGGYSASKFKSKSYYDYGFQRYLWFKFGKYLNDSYWPHILGEGGVIGVVVIILILFLVKFGLYREAVACCGDWVGGKKFLLFMMIWTFLTSFTTPVYTSIISMMTMMLPLALFRTDGLSANSESERQLGTASQSER